VALAWVADDDAGVVGLAGDVQADAAGARGAGYVHLNQLAVEHLLGARG